jgi:hypothetical protein
MPINDIDRKQRSATVAANARAAEARRRAIAAEFRERLLAELGGGVLTITQEALIVAATSCFVEITEGSTLFLRAKASIQQQRQLALSRGQLQRLLASLGLVAGATEAADADGADAPPAGATPEERNAWCKDYIARRVATVRQATP